MGSFEIRHGDPAQLARAAAVRSAREQDSATRARARQLSMAERLLTGFELGRVASLLRPRGR